MSPAGGMFIKVDEEKEQPSLPGFSLLENEEAWERPVGDGERVNLRAMKNLEQVTEGPGEVVESLFSSLGFEEIFGVSGEFPQGFFSGASSPS